MNNIQVFNIQPINNTDDNGNNNNGANISYSINLAPTKNRVTGNFVATDDEINSACKNMQDWDGFKHLVLSRLTNDLSTFVKDNQLNA